MEICELSKKHVMHYGLKVGVEARQSNEESVLMWRVTISRMLRYFAKLLTWHFTSHYGPFHTMKGRVIT